MRKILILIVAAVSVFSCGRTSKKANAGEESACSDYPIDIKIDFDNKKTPEIKIEEVIPLETTEESLLGTSLKLRLAKDHYVVSDQNSIITYSKDGKVENVMKPIGRGPLEIYEMGDVIVEDDVITIQNAGTNKILEFGLYGDLIRTNEQVAHYVRESFNGRYLAIKEFEKVPGDKALYIISDNGEVLNKDIDIVKVDSRITAVDYFQKLGNHVLYRPTYYSTIYMVDKRDSISIAYNIDLGKNWLTKEEASDPNTDLFGIIMKHASGGAGSKILLYDFKESDRHMVISFASSGVSHVVFYDKQTREQYMSKYTPEKLIMHSQILAVRDDKFYTLIQPHRLPDEIKEMGLDIDDEDNPVIVVWSVI